MRLMLFILLMFTSFGCERNKDDVLDSSFQVEIVGFDLNCKTCFLSFGKDSISIIKEIGHSENSIYHAINLFGDTLEVGQKLIIKLRQAIEQDTPLCITMFPDSNYKSIYVTSFRSYEIILKK